MRGFTDRHSVDMVMKFRFVDRGGRYVYEINHGNTDKIMGVVRVDWEKGTMEPDLVLHIRRPANVEEHLAQPAPEDLRRTYERRIAEGAPVQGELDLKGGCMHSWVRDPAKNMVLTCQRCEAELPLGDK